MGTELVRLHDAHRWWHLTPATIGRLTESIKKHRRQLDEIDTLIAVGNDKDEVWSRYFTPMDLSWLDERLFDNRVEMWKEGKLDDWYENHLKRWYPKDYPPVPDHCFDK